MTTSFSTSLVLAALTGCAQAFSSKSLWDYTAATECPNTLSDGAANVAFCEAIDNQGVGEAIQWKAYETCTSAAGCTGRSLVLFHLEQVCTELIGPTCA